MACNKPNIQADSQNYWSKGHRCPWEHLAGQPSAPEDTHWGPGSASRLSDSLEVARSSQNE